MKLLICIALIALTVGCAGPDKYGDSTIGEAAAMVDAPLYVNQNCPVMGGPVGDDPEVVDYNGVGVAFCCGGCSGKWDAMAASEKDAFVQKWQGAGEWGVVE